MLRNSIYRFCANARVILAKQPTYCRCLSDGYRSQYSLDKLYPNSRLNFGGPLEKEYKDKILSSSQGNEGDPFSGYIPIEQLEIKYMRGSGPGGQNVNKVNTKVEVRFQVMSAEWIPAWIRDKLLVREQSKITKEGFLVVTSDRTRKQMLNKADCLEKLRAMIHAAAVQPRGLSEEEKILLKTREAKAQMETLRVKKQHSLKKHRRSAPQMGDV